MSRLRLGGVHRDVRAAAEWALSWADYYGVPVDVTSGLRSWENQSRLYKNYQRCLASGLYGKTPGCQFPANPPGDSSHQYGLAFDSVTEPRYQDWWNEVRRLAGFDVPQSDAIHAQVPSWRNYI